MKTNVKFLALAVVATALAFSCVKEEIAEENINDNQDKTEVEITGQVFETVMEGTKSTLVENTPTWAEKDVIALFGNGSQSAVQLTYAGENKFQTDAGVTVEGPYYAIYPYDEKHTVDQTTGIFTATVPAAQTIAQGQNIAAGALASVAYSEDTQLYFRNAVSLIRIENKREDIVSIKIESTNAEQMLAGTFTMDLNPDKEAEGEEPAVAMTEGSGTAAITLTPEGETFPAGELYAAVLPTVLDGIKVTFDRKGETENETAIVTKTAAVELERNGGANLGSFFTYEIKNAKELLAWNKASAKWTSWDVVTLTDNIDCAGVIDSENWTPNKFTGTFDGNDKTIDNFVIELAGPAAFFGRTTGSAVIKNITFGEGCSFTTTAPTPTGDPIYSDNRMYAAAVVCEATGTTTLSNIKNYGTVTATETSASNGNYIGGIVASHESTAKVSYCDNYGTVIFNTNPNSWVNLGGCFGQVTKATTLEYCNNHGAVKFTGTNSNSSRLNMAGITGGANDVTFKYCQNLGSVEHNATASHGGQVNLAGFIGYNNAAVVKSFENCTNGAAGTSLGAITNNSETTGALYMGGCIAYINGYNTSISNFKNFAAITNNKAVSNWCCMGGIVGYIQNLKESANTISYCENHGNIESKTAKNRVSIGGAVGFIDNSNTSVSNIKNSGKIILSGDASSGVSLGGAVGRIQAHKTAGVNSITSCENEGDITFAGKCINDVSMSSGIGGIIGIHAGAVNKVNSTYYHYKSKLTITGCTNKGTVEKTGAGSNGFHMGGIAGTINSTYNAAEDKAEATITNCSNSGYIHNASSGEASAWTYTGGIVGYQRCKVGDISNCTNSGNITNSTKSTAGTGGIRVGGIAGGGDQPTFSDCSNTGTIKDDSASKNTEIGGICGRFTPETKTTVTKCENSGEIICANTTGEGTVSVGGIVGRAQSPTEFTTCYNMTGSKLSNINTAVTTEYIGGIIGYNNIKASTIKSCGSTSEITAKSQAYSGLVAGNIAAGSSVTETTVSGTFNDTPLNSSNYTGFCFGSSSDFKVTTGITFAE